ncbi:hypothetical protein [Soonwooa sp.]|uniref:hypothetical protein n=1 Tax=Soonwooa sp. TaxID=1938592 RepID=UPI00261A2760|nr:hypothetical protein [Soonwooa sp.]
MKRFLILFSFLIVNQSFAQKKLQDADWVAILSGNIEAYQKYHIKNLKLTNNTEFVKNISYDKQSKNLLIHSTETDVNYWFDDQNRIKEIKTDVGSYNFGFRDSKITEYRIKTESQDSIIVERTLRFPYPKNPEIEWFEHFKTNKKTNKKQLISSQKRVLNPKDSLWGYDEERNYQNFTRLYFNKTNVSFKQETPNNSTYDSTYTYTSGKSYHLLETKVGDSLQRRISKGDSVLIYYKLKDKLYLKKAYENGGIMQELYYNQNNEKLEKTVDYTYYPVKNKGYKMLWEISTKDENTQNIIKTFPNKKYYRLKNDILIKRKRWFTKTKVHLGSCGATCRRIPLRDYLYDITSTSIVVNTQKLLDYLDTFVINEDFQANDVEQAYFQVQFSNNFESKKAIFSGMYNPTKLSNDTSREIYRLQKYFVQKNDLVKDWKVELTTDDGKIYTTDVLPLLDKLVYNVDFMISPQQ